MTDEQNAIVPAGASGERSVAALLAANTKAMASVLPRGMTPERMCRLALNSVRRSPQLQQCSATSVVGAVMKAAALGLEVDDGTGRAHILPFKNKYGRYEAQLIIGYQGYLDLCRRSGELQSASARCVYQGDQLRVAYGLEERLEHVPMGEDDPAAITHAYAVLRFKNGGHHFDVLSRAQIERRRAVSKAKSGDSPWQQWYDEMAAKTALKHALKMAPLSVETKTLIARADEDVDLDEIAALPAFPDEEQPSALVGAIQSAGPLSPEVVRSRRGPAKVRGGRKTAAEREADETAQAAAAIHEVVERQDAAAEAEEAAWAQRKLAEAQEPASDADDSAFEGEVE